MYKYSLTLEYCSKIRQILGSIVTAPVSSKRKCAAVLVPLVSCQGQTHVLLTRRSRFLSQHKGQVRFAIIVTCSINTVAFAIPLLLY